MISNKQIERKALKFYLSVNLQLERISVDGGVVTTILFLHSLQSLVLESTDLDEEYQTASDRLKHLMKVFQGEGSGFSLKSEQGCAVNVASYDVLWGSLFIELPAYIQNQKVTVNNKNADKFCFLYCLSYVRKLGFENPNRTCLYKEDLRNFNVDGVKFPLAVKQIPEFENQNKYSSVSVYAVDETEKKVVRRK